MSKRANADLGRKLGELRDLVAAQDAALGVRNAILLEVDLTVEQRERIAAADAPYCLLVREDVAA